MARSERDNGKLLEALAIGAAIVGVNLMRSRNILRPVSDELGDMAAEGLKNIRRDWSKRVREATGGVEDLNGKSFWSAAGLVLVSTLISACADEPKKQSDGSQRSSSQGRSSTNTTAEKPMPHSWANPADRPGVEVFRPQRLPGARYVSPLRRVEDSNGDYLALESGHAGGNGYYTFGNKDAGLIAHGEYRYAGGNTLGLTVFEVVNLKTKLGAAPKMTRSEFDLKRISDMFRASMDTRVPSHRTEVIVVDARPNSRSSGY